MAVSQKREASVEATPLTSSAKKPRMTESPPATKEAMLEQQLNSALDFIIASGCFFKAPTTLRKLLDTRPSAAGAIATQLCCDIQATYDRLEPETCDARHTGVTSDDISEAMMPYFSRIEILAKLPGKGNLARAYEAALSLKSHSWGDLDMGCGYGDRPSDERGDEVLCTLLDARVEAGETWNWEDDLKVVKREAEELGHYGIKPFYEKYRAKLKALVSKG